MTSPGSRYALIIPALNEAESIGLLLSQIPAGLLSQVIVVDNGSLDATAEVARAAGAKVVAEPRPGFGWNVEMQAKAAHFGLKVAEVPVRYQRRRYGKSKISGTVWGSIRAGAKILWTIFRCWRQDFEPRRSAHPAGS